MELLSEPFGYAFFRQGLAVSVLVGLLCGLIGVYVVLRHMSYIGHGLSHSIFGGAVVSYVLHLNFYLGAGLWGFLSALAINATARRRKVGADAAPHRMRDALRHRHDGYEHSHHEHDGMPHVHVADGQAAADATEHP